MHTEQPLVSICIPSYNYAHYIATTIDSALQQEYRNFEVIIADNASTDDTRAVLERYRDDPRVRIFYREKNYGIAENVSFAIAQAQGEYVVVCGADDALLPNFLSYCLTRMLDQYDPVDVVYAGSIICDEDLRPASVQRLVNQIDLPYSRRNEFAGLLQIVYILFTATLFKKALFDDFSYLDGKTEIARDWEFLLKLAAADIRFASLPDPVILVRYHAKQASSSSGYFFTGQAFQEYLTILEDTILDTHFWRFHGYEHAIIERLGAYDESFRSNASFETLERYEAMVARLKAYAQAPKPHWPTSIPRVSVVLTSDGDPALLTRALDSVLAQEYTDWEVVVVQYEGLNLESFVKSRYAASKVRFSFGHMRLPVARVCGMDLARGEVIAHLDSQAYYRPNHLACAIESLDSGDAPMVIVDGVDCVDAITKMSYGPYRQMRRMISGIRNSAAVLERMAIAPITNLSCIMHYRSILDTNGSLSIDQPIAGDWDFVLRSVLRYGITVNSNTTVELHYEIGALQVERPHSFLSAIDVVYQRFPATDPQILAKRQAYRSMITKVLQQQEELIKTSEGVVELAAAISGLLDVNVVTV